ncbi:MAG: hypothetical protein KBC96_12150 [Armatimonadetes bacterium]|nr:hypothetical protein [Armatimonadota bacterium]
MGCAYLILMSILLVPGFLLILAGASSPPLAIIGLVMCAFAGALTAKLFGPR